MSYCNGTLMMVAKTTGTRRRLVMYIKQYFTDVRVHFLVQYISEGKVKFTLEQATKAQTGRRCIALLFP